MDHMHFELVEDMFDERTRLITVGGAIGDAGVAQVVDAAGRAGADGLVLDLTDAVIELGELMALVERLEDVRGGGRVLVVSPDDELADFIALTTVTGVIDVVASQQEAHIALRINEVFAESVWQTPDDDAPESRGVVSTAPMRLHSFEGVAYVELCDSEGHVGLIGTSARWERRVYASMPSVFSVLVVLQGDEEILAIDPHLIMDVETWVSDDWSDDGLLAGTLAARVFVEPPPLGD